nr:uncharacterized mitochondrial protein AtMg00810-like [Tanacetum cinerariifolium]
MNYQPVVAGNQPDSSAGIQEHFDAGKAGEGNVQQYVLFSLWSTGSKDPQNTDTDTTFKFKKPESEVYVSPSSSSKTKKHDDKTKERLKERVITPVPTIEPNSINRTNTFSAAGSTNNVVSSNFKLGRKFSFKDPSQYPDDPDMLALEDITYSDDEEDVGFKDPDYPDQVYKVVKALNGLHQAPRAWYETLANYLLANGFQRGKIDQTLFIKGQNGNILMVQVYVDDIIFGSTNKELCKTFEKLMKDKFQMSSMGELTFFLVLQVKQKDDGIFINQDKYVAKIFRKFGLTDRKSASTPMDTKKPLLKDPDGDDVDVHTYKSMIVNRIFRYLKGKPHLGLWYPKDSPFNLVAYSDSDYAGASLDRKSTMGGYQFLCYRLISSQCKKQTVVVTSLTEAEYVAAASYYAQVLWIQNQLLDYG